MLCFWSFINQVMTERLLEMLSKHLVNLLWMRIHKSQYETLKPLAKFRNLQSVDFDFDPEDELVFLFENSRTLVTIQIRGKLSMDLLREMKAVPEVYKIRFHLGGILEFQTLSAMITYFHNLYEKREDHEPSTRLVI